MQRQWRGGEGGEWHGNLKVHFTASRNKENLFQRGMYQKKHKLMVLKKRFGKSISAGAILSKILGNRYHVL